MISPEYEKSREKETEPSIMLCRTLVDKEDSLPYCHDTQWLPLHEIGEYFILALGKALTSNAGIAEPP